MPIPDNLFNSIPHDLPSLTLKDAGCVLDGVTDDTANAQEAFDYAARYGMKLVVNGNAFISNNLIVRNGGWVLEGTGWNSGFHVKDGTNKYGILFNQPHSDGITGFRISNLKIDCGVQTVDSAGGIDANGAYRCLFDYVWIHNPMTAGIHLHFGPGGAFGFQNFISHCQIEGGKNTSGSGRGLWIDNADENHILSNHFQDNGGTNGNDNFHVRDENGLNDYIGNDFVNGKGGIKLYATNHAGNRIVANIFDGLSLGNIVDTSSGGNVVTSNRFIGIGFGASSPNSASGYYTTGSGNIVCNNYFIPDGSGSNGCQAYVFFDTGSTKNQAAYNSMATINVGGTTIIDNGTLDVTTPNITGI